MFWIVLIAAVLVLAVVVLRLRSARAGDGVDSFRRQIDALSPEARRPVVDQVQNAASRIEVRPIEQPDGSADSGDESAESDDEPDVAAADDGAAGDDDVATDTENGDDTRGS